MDKKRIFIVEDEIIVARDIANRLTRAGYEVAGIAVQGQEAIQQLAASPADLVLMDIVLRGSQDGIETAAQIRERYDIPVVYLTAYADPDMLQRAGVTGPFGYLLKPFEGKELLTAIEMALYKHQMERALRERERQLSIILDTLPDFILFKDRNSVLQLCNQSYCDYLGREMSELIGTTDFEWFPPEQAQLYVNEDRQVIESGRTMTFTRRFSGPKGERWEEVIKTPLKDDRGQTIGVLVATRDVTDRIKAEMERDQQRQMLRTLIDALPDFVLFKDRNRRYVFANKAFLSVHHLTEAQLIGKTDFDLLAEEDAQRFDAEDRHVLDTRQTVIARHLTMTPRGLIWTESIKAPLLDQGGEVIGLVVAARDLTDRLKVEAERDEQRRMLRALLDTTPDIVVFKDRDSRYKALSERYRQLLAPTVPMEDMLGKTDFDIFSAEEAQRYRDEELHVMQTGETLKAEHLLPTVEGPRWFEAVKMPLRDEAGNLIGVFTSERDITERLKAKAELEEQRRMLRAVLDTLPDFIIFKDRDSVFRVVNRAFCEFVGLAEDDIIGKTDFDLFPSEDAQRYRQEELEVMRSERTLVNVHLLHGTTGVRWDEAIKTPLYDEQGRVMGVLTAGRDVTARLEAEQRLTRRAQEMTALYQTSLEINARRDVPTLLHDIVRRAADLVGAHMGGLYLMTPDGQQLELVVSYNLPKDFTGVRLQPGEGASGRVMQTGQAIAVEDYQAWPHKAAVFSDMPIHRLLAIPLKVGDRILGVLNVTDAEKTGPFTEDEVRLVGLFADQAAIAIENARLLSESLAHEREIEQQNRELQALSQQLLALQQVAMAITSRLGLPKLLDFIARSAAELLDGDSASIFLFDDDKTLTVRGSYGLRDDTVRNTRLTLGQSITGRVAQTGEPLIVADVPNDPRFDNAHAAEEHFLSMISTPLILGKTIIGTLNVHHSQRRGAFDQSHLRILSLLANHAAVAIQTDKLYQRTVESESRYRELFQRSLDGLVLVSAEDGRIIDANAAFQEMLGYSLAELKERKIWEIRAPEHREAARRCWEEYQTQDPKRGRSVPYQARNGRLVEAEHSTWVMEVDGRPTIVSSVRDVTDQLKLEEQLRQAQKMEAIGTLAGGIAHDFNNILGSILGYASFVKEGLPADDPARADLEVIERSARRGAELTRQLLAFAQGGRYEVRPINLNTQVQEIVQLLNRTVDKSIAIRPILDSQAAPIDGDVGQIDQLLLNLCINAVEAMPAGGFLTIETKTVHLDAEAAQRELGQARAGRYTVLTVSDTGHGIDADTLKRIFEPFFSTKKNQVGKRHSGLGLATVFGIVKGHNGVIQVESQVGQGTTFRVWLPAREAPFVESERPASSDLRGGAETVLVVDDEESLRDMLERILSSAGYRVLSASTGMEALQVFDEWRGQIDLVILDMIMPGMNGLTTLARLRERAPNVRVLLSSGYSDEGQARDALAKGARGFIQKPFAFQEILKKVRSVLDEPAAQGG